MKQTILKVLSTALAVLTLTPLFSACGADRYRTYSYSVDGNVTTVKVSSRDTDGGSLSRSEISEISEKCADILAELDLVLSAANENGEVYALNQNVNVLISESEALFTVFDSAYRITELTDGAYDCTAGALNELWSLGAVPSDEDIADALAHTGLDKFVISDSEGIARTVKKLDADAKVDFSVISEGYTAQKLLEYLASTDSACGIVSAGNTVGVYGEKSSHSTFKIGIKDPDGDELCDLYIASGFISTASVNDSFFEADGTKYHSIIDPKTGRPADSGLLEVIVYTSNGASASALSRALLVLGTERSLELYSDSSLSFEAILVTEDGELILTPGIDGEMFKLTSKEFKLSATDDENE